MAQNSSNMNSIPPQIPLLVTAPAAPQYISSSSSSSSFTTTSSPSSPLTYSTTVPFPMIIKHEQKRPFYNLSQLWQVFTKTWKLLLAIVMPIALIPLLLDYSNKANLCLYVLILMATYWMFEPINLYITALIPVALFPLLGISSTDEVCITYMKGTNMMFIGGLIMGIALEHSNLNRRLALKIIIVCGSSYRNLMAGIMLSTMFQSMWINNTATTAMMIPIVDSILVEMYHANREPDNTDPLLSPNRTAITIRDNHATGQTVVANEPLSADALPPRQQRLRRAMLLAIVYAADIGGTATMTGTGTNLVLQEVFQSKFPNSATLTYATWFIYAFPTALLTIVFAWIFLCWYFLPTNSNDTMRETFERNSVNIRTSSRKKYAELGSMTWHEIGVLIHFVALISLWFFRSPGWTEWLTDNKNQIKDATPAIFISILMFLVPANFHQFSPTKKSNNEIDSEHKEADKATLPQETAVSTTTISAFSKNLLKWKKSKKTKKLPTRKEPMQALLNWNVVQRKITWGVIFLLGGGFALAFGIQKSGLSKIFTAKLGQIHQSPTATMTLLVGISTLITQMTSNVSTANIVLPVINEMALQMRVNPLYFALPVTICISFSFMFPVSSPSSALVYEHLHLNILDMAKPGFIMSCIGVIIQLISVQTFGQFVFDWSGFPDWAAEQIVPTNVTKFG